jgi:CRP-like cAMP-binding protein
MSSEKYYNTKKSVYKKGDTIFKESDRSNDLFIIQQGSVKIYKDIYKNGKMVELELSRVGKGEIFGEMAVLGSENRSASVKALEPTLCLHVSQDLFDKYISDMPSWLSKVVFRLADRLRDMNTKLKQEIEG